MKKRIFIPILFSIALFSIYNCKTSQTRKELIRMKVKFCTPITIQKGKLIGDTINVFITTYGNYKIIELPFRESLEENTKITYDTVKYEYLIENLSNKNGYLINNLNDNFRLLKNKDSVINSRAFNGLGGKLITINTLEINTKEIKVINQKQFILKYLTSLSMYDSIYLYFDNNLKKYTSSLSTEIDQTNDSKCYKVEMFIKNDSLKKAYPQYKDFFINSIEFGLEKNFDKSKYINLLERFIKFENKSKK